MSFDEFVVRRLWEFHKSPRDHIDGLLGTPRDYSIFDKMLQEGSLRQDFRFQGFPAQGMESPRLPVIAPMSEDQKRNEENFVKVFGKSPLYVPDRRGAGRREDMATGNGNWTAGHYSKRRTQRADEELVFGKHPVDKSSPPRGFRNFNPESPFGTSWRYQQMRQEAEEDIQRYKEERRQELRQRERERDKMRGQDLSRTVEGRGGPAGHENGGASLEFVADPRKLGVPHPSPPHHPSQRHAVVDRGDRDIEDSLGRMEDMKTDMEPMTSPWRADVNERREGQKDRFVPNSTSYVPSFGVKENTPTRGYRSQYNRGPEEKRWRREEEDQDLGRQAEVMGPKQVSRPKIDPITGMLVSSDVSRVWVNPSYQKIYYEEDLLHKSPGTHPRYVRNTTHSTSNNRYDIALDRKPRYDHRTNPPYATAAPHA